METSLEAPPVTVVEVVPAVPSNGCTDLDIGLAISKERERKSLTTTELAKRVTVYDVDKTPRSISQAQVSRLENGKQGWRSSTLRAFAKALNIELIVRYR